MRTLTGIAERSTEEIDFWVLIHIQLVLILVPRSTNTVEVRTVTLGSAQPNLERGSGVLVERAIMLV
jgi:hypothetical protein